MALERGRVKIVYADASGTELAVALRGPGDLVGEVAGSDNKPRSASAQALEACVGWVVTRERFARFIAGRGLDSDLDRYICAKLREVTERSFRLARYDAMALVADVLVTMVELAGEERAGARVIPLSQKDIGDALGLSRGSVSSVIAAWKRMGVVSTGHGRLLVRDLAALRACRP